MERTAIGKRTRFEVFKRDKFACQYCGATAPDVLLEIDHVQPVSKDGSNDVLNLLTACKACNAGKSDRLLGDDTAIKRQQAQLADLQERRDQLEMMLSWRDGLKSIESDQVEVIADSWELTVGGSTLNEQGLKIVRQLLKKHGVCLVLDAIETSTDRYVKRDNDGHATIESAQLAFSKLGGICALAGLSEDERRLYYIKGILVKRLAYVPYGVIDDLKEGLRRGVPVESMELEAKHCYTWSKFAKWLFAV